MTIKWFMLLVILIIIPMASAIPTTGVAFDVSSNNFTVPVAGSSGEVFVAFGELSGYEMWATATQIGDGNIIVYGAPLIGGSTVYYKACDETGCGSERVVKILAITPAPTTTFGNAYRNMTAQRFRINSIVQNILPGYTATGITTNVLYGIMFFFIFFGFWFRTRSVRLTLILGFIMAAFILTPTAGLYLGAPLAFQYVAQGLMAAAIAGILISFIRK